MSRRALRLAVAWIFTALSWGLADEAAAQVGHRYALIIGVGNSLRHVSSVQRLRFVEDDLLQLERLLRREGYDVTTVPNDRADRQRILEELSSHIVALKPEDTFVLYYAGHGVRNMEVNRKTYWLTHNANLAMLDVEGIRLEHLLSYVADIRARRKLILLDHCFSGDVEQLRIAPESEPAVDTLISPPSTPPAPRTPATGPRLTARTATLAEIEPELEGPGSSGTTVLAAARNEAYELEKLQHGAFTAAILEACAKADKLDDLNLARSAFSLVGYVKPRVPKMLQDAKPVGAGQPPYQMPVAQTVGDADVGLRWTFCMVPATAAQAEARSIEYAATIQQWETRGLLGLDQVGSNRRLIIASVLDKWKANGGAQATLDDREHRLLTAVRMYAPPSDALSEETRAKLLRDALYREGY